MSLLVEDRRVLLASFQCVPKMASTEIEFEDIIEKFKLFSPYHLKLVVLLAFVSFIDAWHRANYIMVVEDVDYW